tara:strand:- start:89 stop:559 length:471 start_codon:yes stop_codon:yes gene_type:complete
MMTTLINTTPNDWEIVTLPLSWDSQTQAWESTHPETGESRLYFRGQWWEISDSDCNVLKEKTNAENVLAKFAIFKQIYTSEVGSWDLATKNSRVTLTHQRPFLSDEKENGLKGDEAWQCWGGKELLAALDLENPTFDSFDTPDWQFDEAVVIFSEG